MAFQATLGGDPLVASLLRVISTGLLIAFKALPGLPSPKLSDLIPQHALPCSLYSSHTTILPVPLVHLPNVTLYLGLCALLFPLPAMLSLISGQFSVLNILLKGNLLERASMSTPNKITYISLSINLSPALVLILYLLVYCLPLYTRMSAPKDKDCLLFTVINGAWHVGSAQ